MRFFPSNSFLRKSTCEYKGANRAFLKFSLLLNDGAVRDTLFSLDILRISLMLEQLFLAFKSSSHVRI